MKETEFERKALISEAEYRRLFAAFSALATPRIYVQTNRYYDTENRLLSCLHATLRVRETDGRFVLQYKYGQTKDGNVRKATEEHIPLSAYPEVITGDMLPATDARLRFFPIGELRTERADFRIGNALVSLDKSDYLGVRDYEIEVETEGNVPLPEKIAAMNIPFSPDTVGKYHRFLAEARRKNG